MKIGLPCALLLLVGLISRGQKNEAVEIHHGMGRGDDYVSMPELSRRRYAMGAVNGMMLAPLFGAPKQRMAWLERCVENMSDSQIAEILLQYIKRNPAQCHHGLHILSFQAVDEVCPGSP